MSDLKNISNILKYVVTGRKIKVAFLLFLNLLSAFFEYFTLAMLVPYVTLLSQYKEGKGALLDKLTGLLGEPVNFRIIIYITVLFIIFIVSSLFFRIQTARYSNSFTIRVGVDLSNDLLKKILKQPYEYNIKHNSNFSIATVNIKGPHVIYGIIQPILNLATSLLLILAILATLLFASWKMVFYIVVFFGVFYSLVSLSFSARMKRNSRIIANEAGELLKVLQEAFSGLRYLILNHSFDYFIDKYNGSNERYLKSQGTNIVLSTIPKFMLESVIMIVILVVIAMLLGIDSTSLNLSVLLLFAIGGQKLLPIVQQSFFYYNSIKGNVEALRDVLDVLRLPDNLEYEIDEADGSMEFRNGISFTDVKFTYNENKPVLNNANFRIQKGQKVGIVGASGSGKSTLVDLILGLIKPTVGKIYIDDIALDQSNVKVWRSLIGSVPQTIILNDQSVYENIAYGLSYDRIDFEKAKAVAKKANIYEDIIRLPHGFDTRTGDKGLTLSGGQRQRIGLARALYSDPEVLILDEATSALDITTEMAIMNSIYNLTDITVLIISHREKSLDRVDVMLRLNHGNVEVEKQ